MRNSVAFSLLLALALLAGREANALDLAVTIRSEGDRVWATADLSTAFSGDRVQTLKSGFTTTLLALARWEPMKTTDAQPTALELKIRYDVWDETYKVLITQGDRKRRVRFPNLQDVMKLLTNPPPLIETALDQLPEGTPHRVRVAMIVNPMSEEEIDKVRDWIENPLGGESESGWVGAMIGALVDEKSGFSTRRIEGASDWRRREGDRLLAAD